MKNETAQLPSNLSQWVPVILATILLVLMLVVGLAVAQRQADEQFIDSKELQQNIQELESYTEEAALLSQYTLNKSAPRAYTQTYSSSLKEATDSITEKLDEHPHATYINGKVSQAAKLGGKLSQQLDKLGNEPINQLGPASDFTETFSDISDRLQLLEQEL